MGQETFGNPEFELMAQAYVDDELAAEDRGAFQGLLAGDAEKARYVDGLVSLKLELREAFPIDADTGIGSEHPRRAGSATAIAASLVAGLACGWLLATNWYESASTLLAELELASSHSTRVLLHIGSRDQQSMSQALENARYILDHHKESGNPVRVHLVANGPGLDILRADETPYADSIGSMVRQYPNLQFVACQNTIDRFEKENKRAVRLLPEVLRVDSGVADIVRKRARGWLYIGV